MHADLLWVVSILFGILLGSETISKLCFIAGEIFTKIYLSLIYIQKSFYLIKPEQFFESGTKA